LNAGNIINPDDEARFAGKAPDAIGREPVERGDTDGPGSIFRVDKIRKYLTGNGKTDLKKKLDS
jgi:hypothetical protein